MAKDRVLKKLLKGQAGCQKALETYKDNPEMFQITTRNLKDIEYLIDLVNKETGDTNERKE